MPENETPLELAPAVTDTEAAMVAAALDDVTTGVVLPVVADTVVATDTDTAAELQTTQIQQQDPATEELLDPGSTDLAREQLLAEMRRRRTEADTTNKALSDAAGAQFVAEVEALLAAQRTPVAEGATKADALLTVVDAAIRAKWGSLPWVRYTRPGRVLSVNASAHTCKVSIPEDGTPGQPDVSNTRTVRTGIGVPVVGRTYAVHFPYALPAAPISLLSGPVPAGDPWLKAPAGLTWIYYLGYDFAAALFAVYRVALPPMDDSTFTYDPRTALELGLVHSFAAGDAAPRNLMATYHSNLIWTDIHRWDSQPTPEDAPSTLPWPTNLHRYRELGTFGPPSQTTDVRTSPTHIAVNGSNLDLAAPSDYLLGSSWYSEQVPEIPSTPTTPAQRGKDILFDLAWSDGGATWLPVRQRLCSFKRIWAFFPAGGYYVPGFAWKTASLQGATGWIADSATPWGAAGARIHVWAVQERDTEPYPDGVRLDGNVADQATLVAGYLSANIPRVRWYVSTGGGSATRNLLPLPPGWLGTTPQDTAGYTGSRAFWCGTLGGQRLWAWWLGHESQSFDPATQRTTATAAHLWYGTGNQDGSEWGWEQRDPAAGVETIQAVNGDGSVLIASVLTDPNHFVRAYYISADTGAHWRSLPAPPFWSDSYSAHQLWLVDTP